jgi:hypothetical protein
VRAATIAVALITGLVAAGCGGSSKQTAQTPNPSTATGSTHADARATLDRAVRSAVSENFRLSLYVLWHNRVPSWAQHSTRGPALAALRSSAATRQQRGIRVRSQPGHYTIVSVQLDPSYTRATAVVRDERRVFPYEAGKRLGRSIAVDDHARIELRRLGETTRFVVWRVRPVR